MTFGNILAIAVALAMDAFAVSLASGICMSAVSKRQSFRLSWHFGFFQAAMPVIGWVGGLTIRDVVGAYAHWVAFVLLAFVGIKMFKDAFQEEGSVASRKDPTKGISLVVLSIATSIDALAVGLSLSMLKASIWYPALVIGIVAAAFTFAGLHLGCRIAGIGRFRRYAEMIGGTVLLGIGFKILQEHGAFEILMG